MIPTFVADLGPSVEVKGLEEFILKRSDDPEPGIYYRVTMVHFEFQLDDEGPHLRKVATFLKYRFSGNQENPKGPYFGMHPMFWDEIRYTLESAKEDYERRKKSNSP